MATRGYTPTPFKGAPDDVESLILYLNGELQKIATAFNDIPILPLTVLNAAPEKIREGMIVFADGTHWNPGSGIGAYERRSGAWHKL